MINFFFIGFITYAIFSILKLILVFLVSRYYKENYIDNLDFSFKVFILESFIYASIFSGFGLISNSKFDNVIVSIVASVFLIALIPTYAYVLSPFRYLLMTNKYIKDSKIDQLMINEEIDYKVRIIDAKVINAYATGILPFTKIILIGKPLVNSLSQSELKSIIFHEIGHLQKRHLSKLYIISILVVVISYFIFLFRGSFQFKNEVLNVASIGLVGAIMGFLIWIIPSKIQYKFEFEADLFSSRKNGKINLIDALNKLDILSNGEVSKGGITHPTLNKRIQNLKDEI